MQMPAEGKKTLNLIIKADGQGSLEALRARMESLSTEEVEIRVIHGGVGAISPNDVNLASASNAVLIGFNIRPDETAKRLAENEGVDLRFYQVIYEIEDDLQKAMRGMLAPVEREVTLGHAEVREVFKVSKVGTIVGCYVKAARSRATRRCASCATRRWSSTANSRACAASRTTFAKSPKASSAASRSRSSRISKTATSSKPTRPSRSRRSCVTRSEEHKRRRADRSRDPAHPRHADHARAARIRAWAFVTVTRVEVSDDLQHCKVFVSVIGDRHQARQSLDALEHAARFLRGELGHKIDLRHTPELIFVEDRSTERAIALAKTLREDAERQRCAG